MRYQKTLDCTSNKITDVPLSREEEARRAQDTLLSDKATQELVDALKQRQADLDLVASCAGTDPVFDALARLLGKK